MIDYTLSIYFFSLNIALVNPNLLVIKQNIVEGTE